MENPTGNTLSKAERLSGKAAVANLTSKGKWGHAGHFKYCYIGNGLDLNRILVSVPKRNFKRAVKRNLLKRRIREAYRTNKSACLAEGFDMMFYYNSTEILCSEAIKGEIIGILDSIRK